MTIRGHLKAALSLSLIATNLLAWTLPLVCLLMARILVPVLLPMISRIGCGIYRQAVAFDDWVLMRISGAQWQDPNLELNPEDVTVVVANHRSWSDVFLLQSIIAKRGPILKFLCKRELAYVPVLGLIFIAFDFPILQRSARSLQSESDRRTDDRRRVHEACKVVYRAPAAMLSFAEGTRFSELKRQRSCSPYLHLLRPRPGGFGAMLKALEPLDPIVVDVTILYPHTSTFWQFLGGEAGDIEILARTFPMDAVGKQEARCWLEEQWTLKDKVLDAAQKRTAISDLR